MLIPQDATSMDAHTEILEKRQYGYYGNGYGYGNSRWYTWGRWVVLGAVILAFVFIFALCSCITARRRRKRGAQPFYGTGWMAQNHGAVNYYGNQNQPQAEQPSYNNYGNQGQGYYGGYDQNGAAPPYSGAQNSGYHGGQQTGGYEMQAPSNTYQPQRGGDPGYSPPSGAPPGKGDVIR